MRKLLLATIAIAALTPVVANAAAQGRIAFEKLTPQIKTAVEAYAPSQAPKDLSVQALSGGNTLVEFLRAGTLVQLVVSDKGDIG